MNKSNSLWGKCILAIACMILCAGIYGEEAHAEEVSLKRGEEVFYEGYSTFYYYINGKLGYCLEPKKSSPHDGTFQAELLDDGSLISKALYYLYNGPGYETYMKPAFPEAWKKADQAYCLSHCILSYIYDGCDRKSDAFLGLSKPMQELVIACTEKVRSLPDVPSPGMQFSKTELNAYFAPEERVQRTGELICHGDKSNTLELTLPSGVSLVNKTKGTTKTGKVSVSGEDVIYFTADAADYNGKSWKTGNLYGKNRQKWRSLVVSTGSDGQHLGTGELIEAKEPPTALSITWIPEGEVEIDKRADKSDKKFQVGDIITYTIDVTQQIEHAVAKNVVITDTILTEGVKLQKNSIVLLDKDQSIVSDAVISVQGNSYTIHAGEFLQSIHTGEKYTVEYQVVITDESVIGKEIHNHVIVRSDNCEEKEDEEKVEVEEPKEEPEELKEEPPKEPEEPEEPKEPELPVPEEPEEITRKVEKTAPVKTGDEGNLMVLIVISILSCTVLFICGRISRKTK